MICLGPDDGIVIAEGGGPEWCILRRGLNGRKVTSAVSRQGVILAGTTDGVFRSDDDGRTWRLASDGLVVPWPSHLVERFVQLGSQLLAVLSNGQLLSAPLESLAWRPILAKVQGVNTAGEA